MGDYIRKSDAIAAIHNYWQQVCCQNESAETRERDKGFCNGLLAANKMLRAIPTANVADRPQGEWKFVGSSIEMMWECPFCGEHTFGFEEHLPNYCSNCGADMRKGVDV